ncbi:nicotinamide riboside transporter PnuC [Methylophaga muralis]|uniref:Nicotinamide riboside transporter PnuC n=1 Tax=Methylophaga muralis TaxID=291169 RepID=A0A1E3GNS8_9GAMM|nr:nicotinamide riboside transporter PnuC [Methylophaga muralis]ODN65713.1 Nicotinamide riboside transporter PnuC [Methylophaga muralis]
MSESAWWDITLAGLASMSGWEVFAALLGIGYILFAARESQWCWPLAFISTIIYTVLFWENQLPMQALLNLYYIGMAVYGFILWHRHENQTAELNIHSWPWQYHLIFIATGGFLSLIFGYYLSTHATQYPYLDAFVMVFSVMNTVLMARKVLQNWLYWQVINSSAIVLYALTGFYATIVMFSIYLFLAMAGYFKWRKLLAAQHQTRTA